MIYAPYARILLRYLAGAGVSYGVLAPDDAAFWFTNPDIIAIASAAIGACVETVYEVAKRKGWST